MKQRSSNSAQRGAIIVLMVPLMGLFLTLAAFALDMGNMYLWRMRIDKAARAGVVAGLGYRGLQGWSAVNSSGGQEALTGVVTNVVANNLAAYGVTDQDTFTVRPTYSPTTDQITATVNYQVKTFLVGRLSNVFGFSLGNGGNFSVAVSSTQSAALNPAVVAMLFDLSGSMLCPSTGSCACRTTGTCGGTLKINSLIAAVRTFAGFFNPNRDLITIIPFNTTAMVMSPLTQASDSTKVMTFGQSSLYSNLTSSDPSALTTQLTALTNGNTNPCDALAESINQFNSVLQTTGASNTYKFQRDTPIATELQPFVVMFSDGAPNAFRGIFNDTALGSNVDLYHYALEWSQTITTNNTAQTFTYRAPGQFVQRALIEGSTTPNLFGFSPTVGSLIPGSSTGCGNQAAQSSPGNFINPIQSCLYPTAGSYTAGTSTYQFSIPYTAGQATVSEVPIETSGSFSDIHWPPDQNGSATSARLHLFDQLPYYCAVEAADYIRTTFGGTIFTVGLGPAAPATSGANAGNDPVAGDTTCNDPLQDSDDHNSRKDFFLTRLAFSRQMFTSQLNPITTDAHYQCNLATRLTPTVTGCAGHRYKTGTAFVGGTVPTLSIGYNGTTLGGVRDNSGTFYQVQRPEQPNSLDPYSRRVDTQGEYYPTNNASDLNPIFASIAKSILLKLTS